MWIVGWSNDGNGGLSGTWSASGQSVVQRDDIMETCDVMLGLFNKLLKGIWPWSREPCMQQVVDGLGRGTCGTTWDESS